MKRRRHTPEQIIRKLGEADRLLAEGQEIPEVAKQLEVSEATSTAGGPSTAASRLRTSNASRSWRPRTPGSSGSWPTSSSRSKP